ncbi:iron ABC transporter permease [Rhizobiaceae bacterium BDR2-2]|uniref:Iron ABC transporter permease n=1 Tax=Ectorhizobium quercum TaxID=2965071 RepID=A0AAE3SUL7_9HYPH|nr:iron ABC transporter permease [Ectorhizobium quercum]MCX8997370.1 iron ABC transporter permease [Ectorhizobium quercum]
MQAPLRTADARNSRRTGGLLALGLLLTGFVLFGIVAGARPIPLAVTWEAIVHFDPANSSHLLVRHLRVPRTLLAIFVGAALGVAGAIMQALTRNPLSDPGILGVNAGAALAIAVAISLFGITGVTAHMGFGLVGAAVAGAAVYCLGQLHRNGSQVRVVLAGAALSVVLLSLTQIVLVNSDERVFDQFRHWATGSLQGRGYPVLLPVSLLTVAGLALALSLAKALDTAALGSDLTRSLGGNPLRIWGLSALAIVMLSGAATAAAGPIGFVGLTAPHIARLMVGPGHRWLLPYSMMVSAILVVAADALGRVIAPPGEVGVGIMVALMGGPFFIALVRRARISRI